MYQLLGYYGSNTAGGTNVDTPAIPDGNFSARGGTSGAAHWIFTEQYNLVALGVFGASVTSAQLFDPLWNSVNIPQIYPVNLAIVPPDNPQVMDLRMSQVQVPMNEEIALQLSNGAGAADPEYGLLWLLPSGQTMNVQQPTLTQPRIMATVTLTTATTAGVWTGYTNLTFTNPLKGGSYQVNGMYLVVAHALAYRISFVRAPLYAGRKLTPGNLVENAYGNRPLRFLDSWLGPMGYFNNFELPQVSLLGTTSEASATYTGYMDLTYLGQGMQVGMGG